MAPLEDISAERIFKTDEQMVSAALTLFKDENRFLVQEINSVDGDLAFGRAHLFSDLNELSHWVWNLPDNKMYVAILTRDGRAELTYRGQNFVAEYQDFKTEPKISFFKALNSTVRFPVDLGNLDENVQRLNRQEKVAC